MSDNNTLQTQASARHAEYRAQGWWPGERLAQRYRRAVDARPDALAVADSAGRELCHADLWQQSGALADLLAGRGIGAGDTVLLFLPNRVEWQIALLAVLRLQAVPASIPTRTDITTLTYAAGLAECRMIVTSQCAAGSGLLGAATQAASDAPRSPGVVCVEAHGENRCLHECGADSAKAQHHAGVDHLMFTSSTTGLPKAVMHSVDTLAALNIQFTERFGLGHDRPIFMSSPLGHSVGGIHGARLALHTGAPLVLQECWDPAQAMTLMENYNCAFTAAATPFLKDLVDAAGTRSTSKPLPLRDFLCGGAPVPPALLERAWQAFPETFFTNLWGMTEGGLVTCVADSPKDKLIETAGIGLPGLELRVLDEDGVVLGTDEEGELAMRGPGVFIGYLGQEELYRAAMTRDGFFRTGDLARIDEDGYVRITGRLKDLIIRGGVNISPLAAEDVLAAHPDVDSVAVVGFPDDRLGERICAVITTAGSRPSLGELIRHAADAGLPKQQWPEVLRFVDSMPRTAAGKIRKADLHEMVRRTDAEQLDLESSDAD